MKYKNICKHRKMFTLYKYDNCGNIRIWSIRVEVDCNLQTVALLTETGILNGKIKRTTLPYTLGKNIGKNNETTPEEQARKDMLSKVSKKRFEGFDEHVGKKGLPRVMLAQDFHQRKDKIVYPWFIQPKLDGIRAKYISGQLFSRTDKPLLNYDHILYECNLLSTLTRETGLEPIFDGEIYSTLLNFETIVGLTHKKKLDKLDHAHISDIIYVIFGCMDQRFKYGDMYRILKVIFDSQKFRSLTLIDNDIVNGIEDVQLKHANNVKLGFEGSILRNHNTEYEFGIRSTNLLKYKNFKDGEFKVIGFTNGKGTYKDMVIWICITEKNKVFKVNPSGTFEQKKSLLLNADKYIGRYLTVKYQELTNMGVPRFPSTLYGGEVDFRKD